MKPDESLGQEILLPIFKTLRILIKLLELGIQFLVLGVTRTFLAQFSISKGIDHDFAPQSDSTFPNHKTLITSSNNDVTSSKPSQRRCLLDSYDPPKCHLLCPSRQYFHALQWITLDHSSDVPSHAFLHKLLLSFLHKDTSHTLTRCIIVDIKLLS